MFQLLMTNVYDEASIVPTNQLRTNEDSLWHTLDGGRIWSISWAEIYEFEFDEPYWPTMFLSKKESSFERKTLCSAYALFVLDRDPIFLDMDRLIARCDLPIILAVPMPHQKFPIEFWTPPQAIATILKVG